MDRQSYVNNPASTVTFAVLPTPEKNEDDTFLPVIEELIQSSDVNEAWRNEGTSELLRDQNGDSREEAAKARTAEFYKSLEKAGIKHVSHPADRPEQTTEFGASRHRGSSHSQEKESKGSKEEWIVVAEGGDGYNTLWHGDFEPVMEQIHSYVHAIDMDQLDLDWEEICDRVPYLKDRGWDISKDRAWKDFFEALEWSMHCTYLDEEWDGGMPGQSGHFFTLELPASQKQSFLETMGQLRASLARYWEEHQLPEI